MVAWNPDKLPRSDMTMDQNILIDKQPIAPCHWASQFYAEPILTSDTIPLRKITTDEEGNAKIFVNSKYLGESFHYL